MNDYEYTPTLSEMLEAHEALRREQATLAWKLKAIPLGLAIMWGNAKAWWFGVRFEFWCAYYEGRLDRWEVYERWYK